MRVVTRREMRLDQMGLLYRVPHLALGKDEMVPWKEALPVLVWTWGKALLKLKRREEGPAAAELGRCLAAVQRTVVFEENQKSQKWIAAIKATAIQACICKYIYTNETPCLSSTHYTFLDMFLTGICYTCRLRM